MIVYIEQQDEQKRIEGIGMNTESIIWNPQTGYKEEELERAAEILRQGGLVAFPTETVYGLGGDGLQKEASKKIYAAKGRPSDNPLILHISKRSELDAVVRRVPEAAERLMKVFWPGPMTLIFEKSDSVPYETTGGLDTVAVRMPSHEGARQLIERAGVPVAAPSANTSGRPSPTKAEHVKEDLDGKIDMIIDGGKVGIGLESTIVDMTEDIPVILRPGYITKEMMEEVIGEVRMDPGLAAKDSFQRPKAPGMKYRHYAPKASMTVYEGTTEEVVEKINQMASGYPEEKVGILATEETKHRYPHGQVVAAGSRKDHTIANGLFDALRTFDHLEVEVIFSESFFGEEKGEAIMNRLLKAAGQHINYLGESKDVQ
jgi:L-threonylcarbamoyladenylate synthase